MTEKRPDYFDSGAPLPPLSPPSMLLMRAGRIAGFDGREGWPDAFTLKELAALQYPDDTNRQGDLMALLTPMVYRGEVEAVTVMRPPLSWIMGVPETYKDLPEPGIKRRPAATFLKSIQEEPSELVREWLGREWQAPESAAASQAGEEAPGVGELPPIPGTLPPVTSGQLAIKAAWQIECETKRRASNKEVMARLQQWADSGQVPDALIKSSPGHAVEWLTKKGEKRTYTLEACKKTLEKWRTGTARSQTVGTLGGQ